MVCAVSPVDHAFDLEKLAIAQTDVADASSQLQQDTQELQDTGGPGSTDYADQQAKIAQDSQNLTTATFGLEQWQKQVAQPYC